MSLINDKFNKLLVADVQQQNAALGYLLCAGQFVRCTS
jgi:hypothetical protein